VLDDGQHQGRVTIEGQINAGQGCAEVGLRLLIIPVWLLAAGGTRFCVQSGLHNAGNAGRAPDVAAAC